MAVEELGESESCTGGELLFDCELSGAGVGAESGALRDLDLDRESEVGFGPDAFALGDIDDFDIEGGAWDVGSGLWGEGEVGDDGVDDDVSADCFSKVGDAGEFGVDIFGCGRDDALGVEHVGEDAFFEELLGCDIGHRVAESALCDFAGGVVYEDDGGCVFRECVDRVDFLGAVDRVGDGGNEIASCEACEREEGGDDGDWFDHVWSIIVCMVRGSWMI